MGDDDLRDAGRERRVDDRVDLGAAEVAGREHEAVAGDDLEHARAGSSSRRTGPPATPAASNSSWIVAPDRLLGRLRAVLARLVLGVDRRQPDDARAAPRGDLHRLRVQPADARVERDRAERSTPGTAARTTAARSAVGA